MFYSSAVVKSTETFDAAASGVLDGDMTGGAYQTGKNAAFQFVGDIMGGYNTPWEQYAWLYYGGYFAGSPGTNHGALLEPIINLGDELPRSDLHAYNEGRWLLLYADREECTAA